MQSSVLNIINQIRTKKGFLPLETLSDTSSLRNDLGMDSLDLAELTVRIEDEFNIDIFADGIIQTVGEVYAKLS